MPSERLRDFLEKSRVPHRWIAHHRTFTARETAHDAHVPEHGLAKTVMVKINRQLVMVVLPADEALDMVRIRRLTGAQDVELAREDEFSNLFPDCEIGAQPPIGKLYGLPQFVAAELSESNEIVFNAGTHTELVAIPYQAYESLVSPESVRMQ